MSYEERQILNKKHIDKPEVGDYWSEMFCPYHIVLAVTDTNVIICDKKKDLEDGWTFDLTETKTITLEEHKNLVTYTTMRDKFVADVTPKCRLLPLVEEWREKRRESMLKDMEYFL